MGLPLEVADGQAQVALHGLRAFGVRRGVGAELEVHGVAAGVHELGASAPLTHGVSSCTSQPTYRLASSRAWRRRTARARLLLERRLLGILEAFEVRVQVAGERHRGLPDRVLLVAFRGLQLLLAERLGRLHVVGANRHLAAGDFLDRVQADDLDVPEPGLAGLDVDLAIRRPGAWSRRNPRRRARRQLSRMAPGTAWSGHWILNPSPWNRRVR